MSVSVTAPTPADIARIDADPATCVTFCYTNHRGETAYRRVIPLRIRFAEPHWLLDGIDVDENAERSFAVGDIRDWNACPLESKNERT